MGQGTLPKEELGGINMSKMNITAPFSAEIEKQLQNYTFTPEFCLVCQANYP